MIVDGSNMVAVATTAELPLGCTASSLQLRQGVDPHHSLEPLPVSKGEVAAAALLHREGLVCRDVRVGRGVRGGKGWEGCEKYEVCKGCVKGIYISSR